MLLKTVALCVLVDGFYNVLFTLQYYGTRCDGLTFLSDITRPAFLIDLRAVQRASSWTKLKDLGTTSYIDEYSVPIPPILLSQSNDVLVPRPLNDHSTSSVAECPHTFEQTADPVDIFRMESDGSVGDLCFGYIHCQVVKPSPSQLNDGTFLCQLNLNSTVFTEGNNITVDSSDSLTVAPAHLVLGLNNHHVISYYWARSAGSGAAMEAPGVILVYDTKTSSPVQIRWASPEGYTACNSNDGKRSEWVQYLKEGDQIQLRPSNIEAILRSATLRDSIYGITMSGRPLGSEPIVVCQWNISAASSYLLSNYLLL